MAKRTVVGVVVAGLVVAACATDDPDATGRESSSPPTTAAPAPTTAPSTTAAPTTSTATSTTIAAPPTTESPSEPVGAIVSDQCRRPADAVVSGVLNSAAFGAPPVGCVDTTALDSLDAVATLIADVGLSWSVDGSPTQTENPTLGTSGWLVHVGIEDRRSDGLADRFIQYWTLVEQDDGALVVTDIEEIETDAVVDAGREHVETYLARLASGDFPGASGLLGQGGQNWDERRDLSAFAEPPVILPDLATALQDWCERGALCAEPLRLTANPTLRGTAAEVVAVWDVAGTEVAATFLGRSYEGAPAVAGLPPIAGPEAVAVIAERSGATNVVGRVPGVGIVQWVDGELRDVPVPDDVWTDGTFFHQFVWGPDEGPRTTVMLADGTTICEVEGRARRVRERADGSYVATVLRNDEQVIEYPEWPIPTYAVDCATGDATPIETISWQQEGGYRGVERVAGRTFEYDGDAEGNADYVNESGVSLNGDDYAGAHSFAPDASVVAYADYTASVSPHHTSVIRVRDTVDGALLWTAELDLPFGSIDVTDESVIVAQPEAGSAFEPWDSVESFWVFDRATGERRHVIPTPVRMLYAA